MTVDQALSQGLLAKLKAAPLSENARFRLVTGHSPSQGTGYDAYVHEETGSVEILGPYQTADGRHPAAVRAVPDDTEWGDGE